jgi:L-seryl-tRNA(Ser) seleniumtransferase
MPSVFDRLPSAQDLLSRPVLRRLTQSLDRQIVVGRVKQYLSELKTQVEQASSEGKLPSITGLAERIARWIAEREQLGPQVVINATGNLFHVELVHAPLAESACAAMVSAAMSGVYHSDSANKALLATEDRLAKLVGAEAAWVGSSMSACLSLVFAAHFADRRVLIRRGDVIELTDGLRLSELAKGHGVDLAEVGASNLVRLDDFTEALQSEATAWLRMGADTLDEAKQPIDIAQVRSQSSQGIIVVEVLTHATVADWTDFGLPMLPVIGDRLAAGVDLVLFSGDCWLGGPAVGLVTGKKQLIEEIKHAVNRFTAGVDPVRVSGLEAALRM